MGAYTFVTAREAALMTQWASQGISKKEILRRTGRSKDVLKRHLGRGGAAKVGRKKMVTPAVLRKLKASKKKLQRKAEAEKEVTVAMIKADAGVVASDRVVLDAFHAEDIYSRPLRERPVLTKADIQERKEWAEKYRSRSAEQWLKNPDAIIDNKHFPLFRDRVGRAEAARRLVRGGYRARGDSPETWLVKQKSSQKFPVKGVQVTAAVVAGKIRMWRYIGGASWCATEAAAMYKDMEKTLNKANPPKAAQPRHLWTILEDNDPTGYKSRAGCNAKSACKMTTLDLPRRSPDLNVLDYTLWHEINTRMRQQEANMGVNRKESVEAFKTRLRRVALTLPRGVVEKAVKDMRRRTQMLHSAKGGLFREAK